MIIYSPINITDIKHINQFFKLIDTENYFLKSIFYRPRLWYNALPYFHSKEPKNRP